MHAALLSILKVHPITCNLLMGPNIPNPTTDSTLVILKVDDELKQKYRAR